LRTLEFSFFLVKMPKESGGGGGSGNPKPVSAVGKKVAVQFIRDQKAPAQSELALQKAWYQGADHHGQARAGSGSATKIDEVACKR
jgi:hypothetical protein